ncbi:Sperm flagellar protein 2 [Anthophora quadrimaculata]
MGEILRNWIQARLGILIDLTPKVFGHYTMDGTLLAQILHSYDIITRGQLDTIIHTQDPALCRVNLKHLRFWLRFVGVDCDDESIEEISCGKGATSLRMFYKLYLSLETKDRLHFITLQKERERFVPMSKKFEVTRVCEDPPAYQPPEHPLAKKLVKAKDPVEWHRSKFPSILRKIQLDREKLAAAQPYPLVEVIEQHIAEPLERRFDARKEESEELDRFARKHRVRKEKRLQKREKLGAAAEEEEGEEEEEEELEAAVEDPEMAKMYVECLKNRRKRAATTTALKKKMLKALLSELWERMAEKQERVFDEVIAKRVLDQSRYEKQIVTKLCEVREQKNLMAENQKVVEDITLEAKEVEHRASYEGVKDMASQRDKDVEIECQRMCELRRRLFEEKVRKLREKHWKYCRQVADDLSSIALNIAEHRRVNHGQVPFTLLSEWRSLFRRSQPIFEEQIPYTVSQGSSKEELDEGLPKSDLWSKFDDVDVLRDALFDDYLETNPPWDVSLPILGEDTQETLTLGRVVLGYIVHRLLEGLYARPLDRSKSLLRKFKHVAIILGIGSPEVYESIRALLEENGVRTIRMDDAINYCLEKYKEEMSNTEYIDLNVVTATAKLIEGFESGENQASSPNVVKSGRKRSKFADERSASSVDVPTVQRSSKTRRSKRSDDAKKPTDDAPKTENVEKQTQTPRNIPYDDLDPVLTDSAYMGKWTYEFLTLGEPISNELATKILIEYLKSLANAKAWALIDYPSTYEQMSRLEEALTGSTPPPDPKVLDFENVIIEDIEPVTPRIVFEDQSDPYALNRVSRIVPDPRAKQTEDVDPNRTFATLFVRVKQQPKYFEIGDSTYEAISKDASSVDHFYASHEIAHILYYATLDLLTLKKLARFVIGDPLLQRKSSKELFGEALKSFEKETKRGPSLKEAVIRRLLTEEEFEKLQFDSAEHEGEGEGEGEGEEEGYEDGNVEGADLASIDFQLEFDMRPIKPGEPKWQWIDFPLSSTLVDSLANLWENLEKAYVEELKELLLLKSVHSSSIVPYTDFVVRNAMEFVNRPDTKQNLLHDFHKAFNAIDEDARKDVDVKCELHRRVADLQGQLWDICDQRKNAAEEERKMYLSNEWIILEALLLYDIYVGIIQVEIDRCVDTIQVLQNYYLGMLKKPLQEVAVSKVILNNVGRNGDETESGVREQSPLEDPTGGEKSTDRKKKERSKTKGESPRILVSSPPAAVDRDLVSKEIDEALIDRNKTLGDIEEISLLKGIGENVRYVRGIVDALSATANEVIKREQGAVSKIDDFSGDSNDSIVLRVLSRGQDLISEWQYAVSYEIERIRLKLDSIIGVARVDFTFLLETVQRTFHGIYDYIVDRYWREMKSVNELANVFCFAIEEGRPLEKEMLLDGDRFVIRSNVYVMEMDLKKQPSARKASSPSRFRIAQLARLHEIFKRVAPYGTMYERTLICILQDLASHGQEEGETMSLPCSWYHLRPRDISKLVGKLFGSIDYIDWREFLVYGMELPIPTFQEILINRDRFRIQDPNLAEVVTCVQYNRTPLWFIECMETCTDVYQLFFGEFQRNQNNDSYDEDLCNFDREADGPSSRSDSSNAALCCGNPEELLRRVLAKRLLGRMYLVDRHTVNYTALLLAFCKDEDPREGFAKALALVLGSRVCTSMEDGEKYAQELLKQKRLWEARRREALEEAKLFLDELLDRVGKEIEQEVPRIESTVNEGELSLNLLHESTIARGSGEMDSFSSEALPGEVSVSSLSELSDPEVIVYWISLDVCLTVLAAALPWHVLQPEVIGTYESLCDSLTSVFTELRDEELNDRKNVVLVHRLLNHDFMKRLLINVNKFTAKNIGDIVDEILRARENAKSA